METRLVTFKDISFILNIVNTKLVYLILYSCWIKYDCVKMLSILEVMYLSLKLPYEMYE